MEAIDLYGMSPEDVVKYLPMKDCGGCGKKDCKEFASALSEGTSEIKECPEIGLKMKSSLEGSLSIRLVVREADESMEAVPDPLIPVNGPSSDSPVLLTGNSAVTLWVLKMIFDKSPEVSAWILPTDTKGFTVDHVMPMNLMTPMAVSKAILLSGIANKVRSKTLIIPGLCEGLEHKIESITRWKVVVGPRSGFELPAYLTRLADGHE